LAIFADEEHHVIFGQHDGQIIVAVRNGPGDPAEGRVIAAVPNAAAKALRLRITIDGPRLSFAYARLRGRWITVLDNFDGLLLASEPTNQFTGAVIGLHASTLR
jgi:beta-xylosidase